MISTFRSKTNCIHQSLLFITLLAASVQASAKSYYFSSSTGNDSYSSTQAQNQATPWKSLAKLNSFFGSLAAGDIVYFKKGDVFTGSITATKSGASGNPITFTSYGSGARPLISGLTTITSWTNLNNGVYQSTLSSATTTFNYVSINGIPQRLGRYPNDATPKTSYIFGPGYFFYESVNAGTPSITDNDLSGSTNWTGAEAVIRKKHWILDRCKITSQSGGTLSYKNVSSYTGSASYGYFIQNDPRTLDLLGEWYLNQSTKALQVYFGGNSPSSYTVKAATVDNLVNLGAYKYISIIDMAFEGANVTGLLAQNGSDISIQQCDFTQMGKDGILIRNSPNSLVEGVNMNYVLNNGISLVNPAVTNSVVRSCTIKNCGMLPGMGASGEGNYVALNVSINYNATVEYNNIDSVGYAGLTFDGNDFIIRFNYINNFCFTKDDGGGIYTNGASARTYSNRQIYNNIVLNSKELTVPIRSESEGIYMDRGANSVDIHDNATAYMGRDGIMLNNTQNVKVHNNTTYDARWGIEFARFATDQQIRNMEVKNNIVFPKTADQATLYYKNWALNSPSAISIQQDIQSIGTVDSNYYGVTNSAPFGYYYSLYDGGSISSTSFSLADWKTFTQKEKVSKNPVKTPASASDVRFEYNVGTSSKTISLDANYVDVTNASYNGSITLEPYTSALLIKDGPIVGNPTGQTLIAAAKTGAINCSGSSAGVAITGSGGVTPYSGTGNFSANAGKGSLKISFPKSVANKSTVLYAPIGAITKGKNYVLAFSTVGTSEDGQMLTSIRESDSPNGLVADAQSDSYGTAKTEHSYLFTATANSDNARFDIELAQTSGTTYVDNIAFFEATSSGGLISNNLFSYGQFEANITGINVWSSNNNEVAEWDATGKINSFNYYTIADASGAKSTVGIEIKQPATPLSASASADAITNVGGFTTVTVTATGGADPYSGTGDFNVQAGKYSYVVTDANGCNVTTSITLTNPVASSLSATAVPGAINCSGTTMPVTVTASGGTGPYRGTGTFSANAGKGSLKMSFPSSVAGRTSVLYAPVGPITAGQSYLLKFSTLGTTSNGKIKLFLRQFESPFSPLDKPYVNINFGTTRIDHEYYFTATSSDDNGRFDIEISQNSGTTYVDNIGFFEVDSDQDLVSGNLFKNAQFENDISGINVWSSNNNQIVSWDNTSKINNINYYTVTDTLGAQSTVAIEIKQSATPLSASVTLGGLNILTVSAAGGADPYTGIGGFVASLGLNTFVVKDANGCSATASLNVLSLLGARSAGSAATAARRTGVGAVTDNEPGVLKITTYPNPATTEFGLLVQGGTDEKIDVTVMSADGKTVFRTAGASNNTYRFGSNLAPGLYIIKVVQGTSMQALKVIKSNKGY